jgi:uncharacterized DUF497 family protein
MDIREIIWLDEIEGNRALVISARDMDRKERRLYGRK